MKWKGISQVRAQCSQFLQLHGYGLKDRKLKYGQGPCPPGWPTPLDWANFRGPGKHGIIMCAEIIIGLKAQQDKELGVEDEGNNVDVQDKEVGAEDEDTDPGHAGDAEDDLVTVVLHLPVERVLWVCR